MSEAVKGIPEKIETSAGAILSARNVLLRSSAMPELGPPDLIILTKKWRRKLVPGLFSNYTLSTYHFAIGRDMSSLASVASYFSLLVGQQDEPSALAGGTYQIVKGTYCSWDPFAQQDLRAEMSIPGSVAAVCVTKTGTKSVPTTRTWRHLFVASLLRSLQVDVYRSVPCLQDWNFLSNSQIEAQFLGQLAHVWSIPWARTHCGTLIGKYFLDCARFTQMLAFFEEREGEYPSAALQIALVYQRVGMPEKAVEALLAALKKLSTKHPDALPLLVELSGCYLLVRDKFSKEEKDGGESSSASTEGRNLENHALLAAQKAVELGPENTQAWIALAKAYVSVASYDAALLALNYCPISRSSIQAGGKKDLVPRYVVGEKTTTPSVLRQIDWNLVDDVEIKEKDALSAASFSPDGGAAYGVLVSLLLKLGWEGLLELRSSVFVMTAAEAGDGESVSKEEEEEKEEKEKEKEGARDDADHNHDQEWMEVTAVLTALIDQLCVDDDDAVVFNGAEVAVDLEAETVDRTLLVDESAEAMFNSPVLGRRESSASVSNGDVRTNVSPALRRPEIADTSLEAGEEEENQVDQQVEEEINEQIVEEVLEEVLQVVVREDARNPESEAEKEKDAMDETGTPPKLEASVVESVKKRKKVICAKWLDIMTHALYEDVVAYSDWADDARKAAERSKASPMRSGTAESTKAEVTGEGSASLWMSRALLAKRLNRELECERAYRRVVEEVWSLEAWRKLLIFYAEGGYRREALLAADTLQRYHDSLQPKGQVDKMGPIAASEVTSAVFRLISVYGLQNIREELLRMGQVHPAIRELLLEAVSWKVHGYDQ
jgi:tetratricopeptide (TPR) repeat protein